MANVFLIKSFDESVNSLEKFTHLSENHDINTLFSVFLKFHLNNISNWINILMKQTKLGPVNTSLFRKAKKGFFGITTVFLHCYIL